MTAQKIWMVELYNIALADIGERLMEHSSWYYTNKNVWEHYYTNGHSPIEAYNYNLEDLG